MQAYIIPLLFAFSVALIVLTLFDYLIGRKNIVASRLEEIYRADDNTIEKIEWKTSFKDNLVQILFSVGTYLKKKSGVAGDSIENVMIQAGYTAGATTIYFASRVVIASALAVIALFVTPFIDSRPLVLLSVVFYAAMMGWWVPRFWVKKKAAGRQKLITKALPDAVDLLVVCVEAGLGLNQAMVRVAKEIYHVSPPLSLELKKTNMEIQTGTSREEAFKNLGERTGVGEIRSLTTMIIQADRFGTSVAQALRVYSESMRTKRRQSAEEAAAKTTVKLVFPLVFFVFPALFVVILGPAALHIITQMRHVQ